MSFGISLINIKFNNLIRYCNKKLKTNTTKRIFMLWVVIIFINYDGKVWPGRLVLSIRRNRHNV